MPLDDNKIVHFPRIDGSGRTRGCHVPGTQSHDGPARPSLWATGFFAIGAAVGTAVLIGSTVPPMDLRSIATTLEQPWIPDTA